MSWDENRRVTYNIEIVDVVVVVVSYVGYKRKEEVALEKGAN
jgi:hypothetical protein